MNDLALKTLEPRELRLNTISLRGFYGKKLRKGSGSGSGDGFPQLLGDVTRWHFGGLTNAMMAAMDDPRLEDADGKGRFLSFKKFAWGGMSGVGGYNQNFNQWGYGNLPPALQTYTPHKVELNIPSTLKTGNIYSNLGKEGDIYDFTLKIVGLKDGASLRITKGVVSGNIERIEKDGIYKIYQPLETSWDQLRIYIVISNPNLVDLNITIEQLPIYPGALVFGGVDDYSTCNNFPIPTKEKGYTVVALRQWISMGEGISGLVSNVKNWFNDGAFVLEYNSNNATNKFVNRPVSFGNVNIEMDLPNNFTYQTSKSYKGVPITTGSFKGTNSLFVGKLNNIIGNCSNVAIWELVFLDHDATEEELQKIQDYYKKEYPWLFPDQAWTVTGKTNEDKDRATIANITGNGNDLVLSNFGFAEGSGYGLYGQNYISYAITNRAVYTKTNSSIHVTKSITAGVNFTESARDVTIPSYRIKVTGIQSGQEMIYRGRNNTFLTNIPSDGIYVLPAVENGSNLGFQFISYTGDCDITIEQIPEYEGYLVTDGVDDKIVSAESIAFTDTWTIITDAIFLGEKVVSAGILVKDIFGVSNLMEYGRVEVSVKGGVLLKVPTPSIKAICSDGRIYDADWNEYQAEPGTIKVSEGKLYIGMWYNGMQFCSIAFKNLAIYPTVLSKEDCIKAYNYLQTLKAK